jgi:hypothetical protein
MARNGINRSPSGLSFHEALSSSIATLALVIAYLNRRDAKRDRRRS